MSTTGIQGHIDNLKQFSSLTFRQKVSYMVVVAITVVLPALYYFVSLLAPILPSSDRTSKGDVAGALGHISYIKKGDNFMGVLVDSLSGSTTIIQGMLPDEGGILFCTSNGWLDGAQLHATWNENGCLEGLCIQPGKVGFGFCLKPLSVNGQNEGSQSRGGLLYALQLALGLN